MSRCVYTRINSYHMCFPCKWSVLIRPISQWSPAKEMNSFVLLVPQALPIYTSFPFSKCSAETEHLKSGRSACAVEQRGSLLFFFRPGYLLTSSFPSMGTSPGFSTPLSFCCLLLWRELPRDQWGVLLTGVKRSGIITLCDIPMRILLMESRLAK